MRHVFFAIPIAPKRSEEQWERLNDLLRLVLNSISNQDSEAHTALVCGHEEPDCLSEFASSNVEFVLAEFRRPLSEAEGRRDKGRKRWQIATEVRRRGGGYYMYLDADDLVHRRLVSHIVGDDNRTGYIIQRGYALDYSSRAIAPIPGVWRKNFNNVCGSSGIIYFTPDDLPTQAYPAAPIEGALFFKVRNHTMFDNPDIVNGRPLAPIPFAAGIYTLNHSINLSYVLIRTQERQDALALAIKKQRLHDTSQIEVDFNLIGFFPLQPDL
jgi:hypothetical protein